MRKCGQWNIPYPTKERLICMSEEVNIVDAENNVLKHCSKTKAHAKGLLHRTVIAEVIDSQGRWILVRQAAHKQDAGQFVSPVGGHIQAGESEIDALKREALEETGLSAFKYKFIGKFIYHRKVIGRDENHYFIVYEIYSDEEIVLNDESVEYKHFTKEELKKALFENPQNFGDAFVVILKNFYPQLLSA